MIEGVLPPVEEDGEVPAFVLQALDRGHRIAVGRDPHLEREVAAKPGDGPPGGDERKRENHRPDGERGASLLKGGFPRTAERDDDHHSQEGGKADVEKTRERGAAERHEVGGSRSPSPDEYDGEKESALNMEVRDP